ncbi:MAG: antitoxin Xre/MbcA/ParS toxin-binding domain-containing protein [Burkholderiales bacterium]
MTTRAKTTEGPIKSQDSREILTKAVLKAAKILGLNQARIASTLGVREPTVTRMASGKYLLNPQRKEWELAALFVRLFRSLDSMFASDRKAKIWLNNANLALGDRPIDLLPHTEGLVRVLHYLDAARARI